MMQFLAALQALPIGTISGTSNGKRYLATKTSYNGGHSFKLVAEELGGEDYVSLNLYLLTSGPKLSPCEMSRAKVINFVLGFQPEAALT